MGIIYLTYPKVCQVYYFLLLSSDALFARSISLTEENRTGIRYTIKILARKVEMANVQEIKTSELRYRRLFEAAQDGILILDAKTGAITDVNPFLIKMLG